MNVELVHHKINVNNCISVYFQHLRHGSEIVMATLVCFHLSLMFYDPPGLRPQRAFLVLAVVTLFDYTTATLTHCHIDKFNRDHHSSDCDIIFLLSYNCSTLIYAGSRPVWFFRDEHISISILK